VGTASQADIINTASADPPPEMHPALDTSVELFRGVYDADTETWYRNAAVKELTGEDEEYLSTVQSKKDVTFFDYMSAVLRCSVVQVGPHSPKTQTHLVNKLILPDRELLFLATVRATYGTERQMNVRCGKCKGLNDVVINLDDDIPVIRPDIDFREPIEVKLTKGKSIRVRMPNGEDTTESQKDTKTDAEVTTKLLSRLAVFEDGQEPADRLAWSKSLSIADRRLIAQTLVKIEAGPKMEEVETQCAHCGSTLPVALDWVSLLFS
jgi:phage FluMu protein Com